MVVVVVIDFLPLEIDGVPTPLIMPREVLILLRITTKYIPRHIQVANL